MLHLKHLVQVGCSLNVSSLSVTQYQCDEIHWSGDLRRERKEPRVKILNYMKHLAVELMIHVPFIFAGCCETSRRKGKHSWDVIKFAWP